MAKKFTSNTFPLKSSLFIIVPSGTNGREKSGIIAHALTKFDLDPVHSIMIGDRNQDISGARENGMTAIAVTYGFGSREELDSAHPDHVVDRSEEIVSILVNPSMAE